MTGLAGASLDALPAVGVLQHPLDQLILVAHDERLGSGAAGYIVVEQLAR
jgi:hypothetical protein